MVQTDSQLHIRGLFGKDNGLPTDRITAAAALDSILYFASDSPEHGGLIAYDPKTAAFALYTDQDGLPTRSVERLPVSSSGQLKVETGVVRRLQASKDLRYPPVFFDPTRRLFSKAGEPVLVDRSWGNIHGGENGHGLVPWLGGPVLGEFSLQGRRILYGSRGVVATTGPAAAQEPAVFSVHESGSLLDEAAAEKLVVSQVTPDGLAPLLRDANPFVRLKALNVIVQVQRSGEHWTDVLASTPEDTFLPVRRLAVRVIAHAAQPEQRSFFDHGLSDPDQEVRDACAYGLAMLGSPAPMNFYESILRRDRNNGWPVPDVYEALAKQPTPEVIALMLRHPLVADSFEPRRKLIQQIGSSLAQYPESVEVLLRARDSSGTFTNSTAFAQAVLAAAGAAIEDRLTAALRSDDQMTRSSAARALGLMGDRTAIRALLAALDRESGQSRASIVWALGKLHASEAVPRLASLYLTLAPSAEASQGGASLTQVDAEIQREYERFDTAAALKASWDTEQQGNSWSPTSGDVRYDNTLTRRQILAALAEFGPSSSRDFYRTLAQSTDPVGRREAAVRLSDAGPGNPDELHSLAKDRDPETSIAAAVSLFLLGDVEGQAQLSHRMEQCDSLYFLLNALNRITDATRLAFLKPAAANCEQKGAVNSALGYAIDRILQRNPR